MPFSPKVKINNVRVESRIPEVINLCTNKSVLHIGCCDMPYTLDRGDNLLHRQLDSVTKPDMLWGVDIDLEGIRLLGEMGFDHLLCANGEELPAELKDQNFDVVLAAEVIEHVSNAGQFLHSLASVMNNDTELILTTPNASSIRQFMHALFREEKVHPDHNYYFSFQTIKHLLEKSGLNCQEIYYYQEIEGKGVARIFDKALSLATLITPLWSDGLIIRANKI